ncbi:type I polyketide synthase [Moorena producens JHB]|uniref:Polyketide synthase n=1 Tax=Moorena producens (strain JHB) TaxID=1454205 RepID=W5U3K4_MOOP1|nr:type I polyketide synthase [Moorena producens]AHH34189.1 polyketide synthase [Moorena producens JHB]AOY79861.2 type I polyketide synthase [Moorena producens JHB]
MFRSMLPVDDIAKRIANLSPEKLALLELQLQKRKGLKEPIAIIGIGCRFPGASSPKSFWQLLKNGVDAITEVPADRWDIQKFYDADPTAPGKMYCRYGGFLAHVDQFDPEFFGIAPREATYIDPQQRLLLEVIWEALEDAGQVPSQISGSQTGVFVGISTNDYGQLLLQSPEVVDTYTNTGVASTMAANRISYLLNLKGPSLTVDTACSSSLVAIHLACQSIWNGESTLALAGGVNLMLTPVVTVGLSKLTALSPDGRCKAFDSRANGFVRGEGAGVIVVKPLSKALIDKDPIYAVIRGSAVNQDGRTNGLTAPSRDAQEAVLVSAYQQAGISPSDVQYVETHGTGTLLGDPIEAMALGNVLKRDREAVLLEHRCDHNSDNNSDHNSDNYGALSGALSGALLTHPTNKPVAIGSVKSNIGHLEAAAGIASLIKVALSLKHQELLPSLHFQEPNPHIPFDELPLRVQQQREPWPWDVIPPFAGVSSFGFGGTNAHVVLQGAPDLTKATSNDKEKKSQDQNDQEQNYHLFTLSAKTATALQTLGKGYIDFIASEPSKTLADICLTSNKGRSHFNYRLALLVQSTDQLQQQLTKLTQSETISDKIAQNSPTPPEIVFLFTGQGSQYSGMGRQLYETQPIFAGYLDQCAEILQTYLEQPLLDVLYREIFSDNSDNSTLNQTAYTQPALFALEYSLAQLWRSWGIEPTVVMGHSVGEYVAATVAGVFSLEDGLKLIAQRARLMQQLPEGGEMAVVLTNEQQVTEAIQALSDKVSIAAINGPENIVISGESEAVQTVIARLRSQKVKSLKLPVSHAFHSALMQPMVADFAQVLSEISLHPPQIEIISNLTGKLATAAIATTEYWCDHVLNPVKFYQSMETLYQQGYHLCVEVGPKPSLLGMGRQCLPKGKLTAIPSLRPGKPDSQQILESLASLYKHGASVDWGRFHEHNPGRLVSLPTYPFERQRYWLDTTSVKQLSPISYGQLSTPSYGDWLYEIAWRPKDIDASDVSTDISTSSTTWLIFADQGGFGETLVQQLEEKCVGKAVPKEHRVLLISRGSSYEQLQANHYQINPAQPQQFQRLLAQQVESLTATSVIVVHMWSLDTPAVDGFQTFPLDVTLENGCGSVLHLLQALVKAELAQSPRLWLLTQGTQPVGKEKSLRIAQSPLWGLGAVIAQEHPELWGGIIDLEPSQDSALSTEQHYQEQSLMVLKQILRPEGENQLVLRDRQTYVPRLIHQQQQSQLASSPLQLKPDSTYLITGGLGSLGLKVAEWMVDKGARYLVLVGRSQPNPRASEIIEKLEEQGVMVVLEQVDVSQEAQVRDCLNRIQVSLPPLKGIIHGAGVLEDGVLLHQDWAKFAKVMKPKVEGAWNLHLLTQDIALDLFVLFSSATSILGTPGQGNYSAANRFLDSLSHYRRQQGSPALSINWGPWAEMGLAAGVGKRMTMLGIEPIQSPQGLQILEQLLAQDVAQVGVLPVEWSTLKQRLPVELPLFLSEVITTETLPPQGDGENDNSGIFDQLLASTTAQREELLKDYLKQQIAKALGISREIPVESNLMDLGTDSLMIVEVLNSCKKDLKITLYPREFYERPTITALAEYLALEMERLHQPQPTQTSLTTTSLSDIKRGANAWAWNNSERKFSKPSQRNRSMVFLLCSPRSGSTLLRVMLAGHRDLFCPPELHLLPFETMAERNQSLGSTHLGEGLARAFMEIMNLDAQASTTLVEEITEQDWSIQKVYGRLQELTGKRTLVDKSPTYAGSIETLRHGEDLFEEAKYIHLVRHPYAVIDSFVKNRMDKIFGNDEVDPYWLAEEVWTTCNRNILDFFEEIAPSNHHLVYYEELVKQPAKVMARLCEFLGIPFDEAVLEPYQGQRMTDGVHPQSLPVDDPNFRNHNQIDSALGEVWRQIQLPRPLGKFAEEVATRLDYQLPLLVEPSAQPANLPYSNPKGEQPDNLQPDNLQPSNLQPDNLQPDNLQPSNLQPDNLQPSNLQPPNLGQKATLREQLEPMQESYLDVRGLRLCLCSWGPADGELILCVHGVLEHGAAWEEIARPLASMGYRVVAPDQRGHGLSQHVGMGGSYQLIDYLGDLDAIAFGTAEPNPNPLTDQPFILVGHSMGAVVAATFASVRPEKVKSLVLLEPVLPGEQKDDQTAQNIATHLDYLASPPQHQVFADIEAAANRLRRLTPNLSEELALKHAERLTEPFDGGVRWRWDPRLQIRTGIGLSGTGFNRDKYTQLLSQIKAPTTLVYGNNSNFNRPEDLALQQAAIPHAKTVKLSGGHNLHVDAPDAIVAIIAEKRLNLKN